MYNVIYVSIYDPDDPIKPLGDQYNRYCFIEVTNIICDCYIIEYVFVL